MLLPGLIRDLLMLFLPAECPVCGRSLRWGEIALCDGCLAVAIDCQPSPLYDFPGLRAVHSACGWSAESRALVRSFKYHYRPRLVAQLLSLIEVSGAVDALQAVDVIIPVPLHTTRRRERGYNQAELLGKLLAQLLGAPLSTGNLVRCRSTASQTRLNKTERRRNVAGAFAVRQPQALTGCTVLLVDDVTTTGATLCEVAAVLPAAEVLAWTLVRRELSTVSHQGVE